MAVFLHSGKPDNTFEVGEYQQFPRSEPVAAAIATRRTLKPNLRHLSVVLLSFGILCVLQAVLNISLRVGLSESTEKGMTVEETCPQGWLLLGSSCYYVSLQRKSWDLSRQDCLLRDADLVIINSRQEQDFLTGFAMTVWIGMTDRQEEGSWIWVDGTPVNKDGSLLWALGQPDNAFGGEDCGDLWATETFMGLNDFNCSARAQWICEKTLR
ncbi:asialoglycoprotein receptor 2-like isoform X1 [Acanthochromis polyacanthus]|uniref:Asialoglycoprotein receptor 2-like n=1 Tax=Acanthochromis polyacanthus TaxID=80966 RepID=A0A3Q1GFH4_9TELE|nr:asialoglycoprotein receptor 2-like isoform X1 [Acanthochromis polyacanthus]